MKRSMVLVAIFALIIAGPALAAAPPASPSPKPAAASPVPKTGSSPPPKTSPGLSTDPSKQTSPLSTVCPTLLELVTKDSDYKWLAPAFPKGALGPVTLLVPLNGTHTASPLEYVIPGEYAQLEDLVAAKVLKTLANSTVRITKARDTVLAEVKSAAYPVIDAPEVYGKCPVYLLDDVA